MDKLKECTEKLEKIEKNCSICKTKMCMLCSNNKNKKYLKNEIKKRVKTKRKKNFIEKILEYIKN